MERLYAELSEYYVFDKAKYTLEEFFGDIKTFKDQFKQVRSIDWKIYLKSILLGLRFDAERERGWGKAGTGARSQRKGGQGEVRKKEEIKKNNRLFCEEKKTVAVCRSDRAAKKRALVDFNADDNQEGVMDRLN